jgi:hypothetical protein
MTVFWFGPQNPAGYGLPVMPQNRREGNGMGHASRSSGLIRVEASRNRVFQSSLKTGGGVTMGGARGTIMEVVSRSSQIRMDRCDELHQTLLQLLCCFSYIRPLGHLIFLVFYLSL